MKLVGANYLIRELAIASGALSSAANAYHVIAAHQTAEDSCVWPVCKNAREARERIATLVGEIKDEELSE